jgi:hypothetical protein
MERSPYLLLIMLLTIGGMSLFTLGVNQYCPHSKFNCTANSCLEDNQQYDLIWEDIFEREAPSEDQLFELGQGCQNISG